MQQLPARLPATHHKRIARVLFFSILSCCSGFSLLAQLFLFFWQPSGWLDLLWGPGARGAKIPSAMSCQCCCCCWWWLLLLVARSIFMASGSSHDNNGENIQTSAILGSAQSGL